MKLIQKIICAFALFASSTTATQLRSQNHLGNKGFMCGDQGWLGPTAEKPNPSYPVRWCFNGAGCGSANDWVTVTVTSKSAYIACRAEASKIIKFVGEIVKGVAMTIASKGQKADMLMEAISAAADVAITYTDSAIGGDGCYCYAQRWKEATMISAMVTSDAKRTVTVELDKSFITQADSENIQAGALLKIRTDSCTESVWNSKICQQYSHIRTKRKISWSDLADELAWLGDRGTTPKSLYIWKGDPSNPNCAGKGRKQANFSKEWCFNNAGCSRANDKIRLYYYGWADIQCAHPFSSSIPNLGTMIWQAYGLSASQSQTSGCLCYPTNFDNTRAIAYVRDDSGDYADMAFEPSQFWGLMIDTVKNGVWARTTDTISNGNWRRNIRDGPKSFQVMYEYDWDEFGDDIAWLGDRNANPDGLKKLYYW